MGITEDEATVYDRQIRLWGLETQQRLQSSRVLVIGMRALASEICKDIVLAGVGSLTVWDGTPVREVDLAANFLLRESDLGTARSTAALERLRNLNPRVQLTAWTQAMTLPTSAELSEFDVVCLTTTAGITFTVQALDALCRKLKVLFFAGGLCGKHGWLFVDLHDRTYLEEHTVPSTTAKNETETVRTTKQETYGPFGALYDRDWSGMSPRQLKRISRLHFGLEVLRQFEHESGVPATAADVAGLADVWAAMASRLSLPADLVSAEFIEELATMSDTELSPVAAIVGGVAAQEIVKAVSGKGAVVCNCLYFDGASGSGEIETFLP